MTLNEILARKTALVVIDMQNDYCHPQGSFGKRGTQLVPDVSVTVRNLQRLAARARESGIPVFFVRTEHGPWSDSPSWLGRLRGIPGVDELPVCAEASWGAEFFGVQPQAADRVVLKHRYSAFVDTPLHLYLRAAGVETIVVGGVVTNVCVESTVRDAFMRDYHVVTVSDCCSATSGEEHDAALFNLNRYFGIVSSCDEVLPHLRRAPGKRPTTSDAGGITGT